MDTALLVVEQIPVGGRLVRRFLADGYPLHAAFWAHPADDGDSILYLATELVDSQGPAATYEAVSRSLHRVRSADGLISLRRIKAVSPHDAVVRAVEDVVGPGARKSGTHVTGQRSLGPIEVEYLYVYGADVVKASRSSG